VEVTVTDVTRSRECPVCGRLIMLQFTTRSTRVKRRTLLTCISGMPEPARSKPRAAMNGGAAGASNGSGSGSRSETDTGVVAGKAQAPARAATGGLPASVPPSIPAQAAAARAPYPAGPIAIPTPLPPVTVPVPVPPQVADAVRARIVQDPEVRSRGRRLVLGLVFVAFLVVLAILGKQYHWWDEVALGWQRIQSTLLATKAGAGTASGSELPPTMIPGPGSGSGGGPGNGAGAGVGSPAAPTTPPLPEGEWDPEKDAALKVVNAFLGAKNVEERLLLVRDSAAMEAKLRTYYQRHPAEAGPVAHRSVEFLAARTQGEHSYDFSVALPDGTSRTVLALRPTVGAPYTVDWGSFVMYSDLSWAEMLEKRPTTPVFARVMAAPDNYYNYNFLDSQRLLCVRLTDPQNPAGKPVFGYCNRSSELGRSLDYMVRKGFGQAVPLMVELRFPDPKDSDRNDQAWVERIVSEGWVAKGY
jgi:hypothetical protein